MTTAPPTFSSAGAQKDSGGTETDLKTLRDFLMQYNNVTELCFSDCVKDFTSRSVSDKEDKCATNCLDKYLKMTQRLSLRFQEHQLLNQEVQGPVQKLALNLSQAPSLVFSAEAKRLANCQISKSAKTQDENTSEKLEKSSFLSSQYATYFMEVNECLCEAKAAFADTKFLAVLLIRVRQFLDKDWEYRSESESAMVQRIFALVRNALLIQPTHLDFQRCSTDITSQDRLITCLFNCGWDDVILLMAQNKLDRQLHTRLVEIVSLIFKEHVAESLATTYVDSLSNERKSPRIGTLPVNAPGKKRVAEKVDAQLAQSLEMVKATRSNKMRIASGRSSAEVRTLLATFCYRFIDQCYNAFSRSLTGLVSHTASSDKPTESALDTHYCKLVAFMLDFWRTANSAAEVPVLATAKIDASLTINEFHRLQTGLDSCLEAAKSDKEQAKVWGERARVKLELYNQLLLVVQHLGASEIASDRSLAEGVKQHIFYVQEHRELAVNLFKKFAPVYMSTAFRDDIIGTAHVFTKMLEKFCKRKELVIQKRRKKVKRAKKGKSKNNKSNKETVAAVESVEDFTEPNAEHLESVWTEIVADISDLISKCHQENGHFDTEYDAFRDVPEEEKIAADFLLPVDEDLHKRFALARVQRFLRDKKIATALALFQNCSQLWADDASFSLGHDDTVQDILERFKDIFMADLSEVGLLAMCHYACKPIMQVSKQYFLTRKEKYGEPGKVSEDHIPEGSGNPEKSDENGSENSEMESDHVDFEIKFDFKQYLAKFARGDVLKWYMSSLQSYRTNDADVNHQCISMMHRMAVQLNYVPLLFQASLFRTLLSAKEPPYNRMQCFTEIRQFASFLFRSFVHLASKGNRVIFAEILFLKATKEAYEIEHGYDSWETQRTSTKAAWTDNLETELKKLYHEFNELPTKPDGVDVADYIQGNLPDEKDRRQIIKCIKKIGLDTQGLKYNAFSKSREKAWSDSLDEQLRNVFTEFCESLEGRNDRLDSENVENAAPTTSGDKGTNSLMAFIQNSSGELAKKSERAIMKRLRFLRVEGLDKVFPAKQRKSNVKMKEWSEAQNDLLKESYDDWRKMDIDDRPSGMDILDYIQVRLGDARMCSRTQILLHLKHFGLDAAGLSVQKKTGKKSLQKGTDDLFSDGASDSGSEIDAASDSGHDVDEHDGGNGVVEQDDLSVHDAGSEDVGNRHDGDEKTDVKIDGDETEGRLKSSPTNVDVADLAGVQQTAKKRRRIMSENSSDDDNIENSPPVNTENGAKEKSANFAEKTSDLPSQKRKKAVVLDSDED